MALPLHIDTFKILLDNGLAALLSGPDLSALRLTCRAGRDASYAIVKQAVLKLPADEVATWALPPANRLAGLHTKFTTKGLQLLVQYWGPPNLRATAPWLRMEDQELDIPVQQQAAYAYLLNYIERAGTAGFSPLRVGIELRACSYPCNSSASTQHSTERLTTTSQPPITPYAHAAPRIPLATLQLLLPLLSSLQALELCVFDSTGMLAHARDPILPALLITLTQQRRLGLSELHMYGIDLTCSLAEAVFTLPSLCILRSGWRAWPQDLGLDVDFRFWTRLAQHAPQLQDIAMANYTAIRPDRQGTPCLPFVHTLRGSSRAGPGVGHRRSSATGSIHLADLVTLFPNVRQLDHVQVHMQLCEDMLAFTEHGGDVQSCMEDVIALAGKPFCTEGGGSVWALCITFSTNTQGLICIPTMQEHLLLYGLTKLVLACSNQVPENESELDAWCEHQGALHAALVASIPQLQSFELDLVQFWHSTVPRVRRLLLPALAALPKSTTTLRLSVGHHRGHGHTASDDIVLLRVLAYAAGSIQRIKVHGVHKSVLLAMGGRVKTEDGRVVEVQEFV